EVRGYPEVQPPPAEHRARVHAGHRDRQPPKRTAEDVGKAERVRLHSARTIVSRGAPQLRLLDATLYPQREKRREHADEEHRPPSPSRQHNRRDGGRERIADRPGALHEAERFAAVFGGPGLRYERRTAGPLAAH